MRRLGKAAKLESFGSRTLKMWAFLYDAVGEGECYNDALKTKFYLP